MNTASREKRGLIIRNLAFCWLLTCAAFVWGVAFVKFGVFPYEILQPAYTEIRAYLKGLEDNEKELVDAVRFDHQERRSAFDFGGFKASDPTFKDDGYLLLSRYSKQHKQCIVELFSIPEQAVLHTWVPDIDEILARNPALASHRFFTMGRGTAQFSKSTYQCRHPMLLEDGDLLIQCVDGPLTRIDAAGAVKWQINRAFHHSLERTLEGNFVGCTIVDPQKVKTSLDVRDDGFAIVSPDGDILEEYSVMELLVKNGYGGIIYGVGKFEWDRIHLNDAHPITVPRDYAHVGDIMLSCATISTVALFRPSTGKVLWAFTGPWMAQHDVNDMGDGTFSIFANNVVDTGGGSDKTFELPHSDLFIYDPVSGALTSPYRDIMKKLNVRSVTEGRLRILENGDAFIEETNKGRLLRLSPTQVRWEYVNAVSERSTGAIHWCRYLPASEVDTRWIKD